ncbi:MAG: adenylate/guanylate cyclase domain-containing protein [Spirochaetales bacterium]|nr:adenylate/guanylate cyclase domain-containing protein [Spirochaetales bacterium]
MKRKKYIPITRKINAIIIISLIIGIGTIISYYYLSLFMNINDSTRQNLLQQSDILYTAIENYMIPGEAPLAANFFNDINKINPEYTIKLFRSNGVKAFRDNNTISFVNNSIGVNKFLEREVIEDNEKPIDNYFSKAIEVPPRNSVFRTVDRMENTFGAKGKIFFRIYRPLINLPRCTVCHGGEHTIRGVIDIRNDITKSVNDQYIILFISIATFVLMVSILAAILSQYLKGTVIQPVKSIGDICTGVTQGVFDKKVSIKNRDEIGALGNTVNTMVEGLHERFKLSKFVSSSTIESLKTEEKGHKVPVTIFFSDIRGFTSFTELNKPETVVESLNKVLNFQSGIIQENKGDIDKYVGDEIVAIFTQENSELSACISALKIQKELKEKSGSEYNNLKVGIGINYGEVILGMIGSEKRADYTIIGDNVNTASRLCNLAKSGQIIISESTYEKVKDQVKTKGPYKVKVKGKEDYLHVYLLTGIYGG